MSNCVIIQIAFVMVLKICFRIESKNMTSFPILRTVSLLDGVGNIIMKFYIIRFEYF